MANAFISLQVTGGENNNLVPRGSPSKHRRRHRQSRDAGENCRVTATSASWNVTYFACRVTLAPILIERRQQPVSYRFRQHPPNSV
jgi:hypothetical protein